MPRFVIVLAVVLAACRVGGDDPDATGVQTPPTPAPTQALATTSTTVVETAGLCHGYLVLLRTGDDALLREELEDPELVADLDAMLASEGEFQAIAQAALDLEEAVVAQCEERFAAGVGPAPDDATALTGFLEAVIAGDEEAGADVAWANVVAQFEPWSPVSGPGEVDQYTVDASTATAVLAPSLTVTCRASGGLVTSCTFTDRP